MILVGKPVERGTRLAVEFVLDLVATGSPFDEILTNRPGLTVDDIRGVRGLRQGDRLREAGASDHAPTVR